MNNSIQPIEAGAQKKGQHRDQGPVAKKDKYIVAVMRRDTCAPYSKEAFPFIPYVEQSTHPRFNTGTRLDYGFLRVALEEGYEVKIIPPTDEQITKALDEYEAKHGPQDWITWRPR